MQKHHLQCIKYAHPSIPARKTLIVCSVWKPLRGPLQDWPLAVCDAASVDADNLVVSDKVYSDFATENIQVHWDARQRWYYLSGQQPDELLVFRQTDSKRKEMGGGGEVFSHEFRNRYPFAECSTRMPAFLIPPPSFRHFLWATKNPIRCAIAIHNVNTHSTKPVHHPRNSTGNKDPLISPPGHPFSPPKVSLYRTTSV